MRGNNMPLPRAGELISRGLIVLVRLWQTLFSAWMAPTCRFVPSCSDYSIQALREHGLLAGLWLTIRRLSRCHPFGGHGLDEVPPARMDGCCSHGQLSSQHNKSQELAGPAKTGD